MLSDLFDFISNNLIEVVIFLVIYLIFSFIFWSNIGRFL